MSKERVEGVTQKGVGAVKEAAGKVVGNERLQAEGAADKAVGAAKEAVGKAKDAVLQSDSLTVFVSTYHGTNLMRPQGVPPAAAFILCHTADDSQA